MSKSKTVTTLQDLKQFENDNIIINSRQYKEMKLQLIKLQDELEKQAEENESSKIEVVILKDKIDKLAILCRNYKDQIDNKQKQDEAYKKSLQEMKSKVNDIDEEVRNIPISKYSKKSREELEEIVLKRMEYLKKYNDLLE